MDFCFFLTEIFKQIFSGIYNMESNNCPFRISVKSRSSIKNNEDKKRGNVDFPTKNAFFLGGGGTKGVFAIGVIEYLFDNNPYFNMTDISIFGGTSIGSYFAAALSIGFRKPDFEKISTKIDLSDIIDNGILYLKPMYHFLTQGFLYNDHGRRNLIKNIINEKLNTIKLHLGKLNHSFYQYNDLTFGDLRELIEKYPDTYKHLIINTVDISRGEQIFMTTMDSKWDKIKLFDAMLASSSIPFVFKPVSIYFDPETETYGYQKKDQALKCILVDGGVSTNNPLDYFLLNGGELEKYQLWLLKFSSEACYVELDNSTAMLKQLIDYSITGKNNTKMDLVEDEYHINTINLHLQEGTLKIYTKKEIQKIIEQIYYECKYGKIHFINSSPQHEKEEYTDL